MRRVVIASPWRGDEELHRRYLAACLRDSYARGEAPIASHAIGPLCLDEADPVHRAMGIMAGLAWIRAAQTLAVYRDLGISEGMRAEIAAAAGAFITIEHRKIEGWQERKASGE